MVNGWRENGYNNGFNLNGSFNDIVQQIFLFGSVCGKFLCICCNLLYFYLSEFCFMVLLAYFSGSLCCGVLPFYPTIQKQWWEELLNTLSLLLLWRSF